MSIRDYVRNKELMLEGARFFGGASGIIFSLLSIIVLGMWGCPKYEVYKRTLVGQAELKQAEWNRQIKIQEANATKESASALAEAEIRRAKGVAEANKIIGTSLKNNEAYLRWLWINNMDNQKEVIYIPTEAGMPILEAGKR